MMAKLILQACIFRNLQAEHYFKVVFELIKIAILAA